MHRSQPSRCVEKKKASRKSILLADLLNDEIRADRAAERACTIRQFDLDSESVHKSEDGVGSEDSEDETDGVELPDAAALVTAHGAFVFPVRDDRAIMAPDLNLQSIMHREIAWHDKKVVHIWDSGWLVGTFRGKHTQPE